MLKSRSYIATPPGATIKEQLHDRGLSQKEFAVRMNMSEKHISKLIHGEVQLTPDVAVRLEMVLGIPARFWNNLEATYREKMIKATAENEMEADIELAKKFPYNEMAKNGWVSNTRKPQERVFNLRKFFEVVKLDLIKNPKITKIACRRFSDTEKCDYALLAWAQEAKIEARNRKTSPVDLKTLEKKLPDIRKMTQMKPEVFCPELIDSLADCGIAMIFLPYIGGSFLHGATFCEGEKIVVGLTVRGKYADMFWFSFFHEIGHILLGHIHQPNGTSEEDESAADAFARDTLIPEEIYSSFVEQDNFNRDSIISFAKCAEIDPGIVVGRLQKDGYLQYNKFNEMRTKYKILTY